VTTTAIERPSHAVVTGAITPLILDASRPDDRERLARLRASGRVWAETDGIVGQLRELAALRVRHVDATPADLDAAVLGLLGDTAIGEYGRWVYFPWSGRLVHVLPPAEFRRLRLDRNRHKITADEADRLARFDVGVIGLSAGSAIAVTLAMEGVGSLRLADLDQLELSNMNRVRAAVHEIGNDKSTIVARQIWEFDPYARLSVVDEGVTPDNVAAFLDGLDVVIEECDSLAMKFAVREHARVRRLPVLMATSDRGLFDIERFDLDPDRPLFHGLAGEITSGDLDALSGADGLTRERKAALVVQILGADRMSPRLAASLLEIDATVSTWPQLCGDVLLGAASAAYGVRALATGMPLPSGRHSVDLETFSQVAPVRDVLAPKPALGLAHPERTDEVPEFARWLVSYAVLAPSGGNDQPWHFYWADDRLWVAHDRTRSENCLDGRHHAALLALGAATENIAIAAAAQGLTTFVRTSSKGDFAAEITFAAGSDESLAALLPLVTQRHTNRHLGSGEPLADDVLAALEAAAARHASGLQLVHDRRRRADLGHILGAADRVRFLCAVTHRDLFAELRLTDDDAQRSRDGIALSSLPLDAGARAAIQLIARSDVRAVLDHLNLGTRLETMTRDAVTSSSSVALLTIANGTPDAWFAGGRAMQRVWLEANRYGIALQPVTAMLYMLEMAVDRPDAFSDVQLAELADLRRRCGRVFDLTQPAALMMRLSQAPTQHERSLRLPPEWVLTAGRPPQQIGEVRR
jgi:molybdopterin/thiamine biosynthesis adenylyltransferase/nitroreductase